MIYVISIVVSFVLGICAGVFGSRPEQKVPENFEGISYALRYYPDRIRCIQKGVKQDTLIVEHRVSLTERPE